MTSKTPQPLPVPIDFYLWIWACIMLMIGGVVFSHLFREAIQAIRATDVTEVQGGFAFMSPVGDAATLEDLIAYEPTHGQSFGPKTSNKRSYGPHGGVDFDCSAFGLEAGSCAGLPVFAMLGGEVVEITQIATSSNGASYRLAILVEDWTGPIEHRYVHVDSLTVSVGDIVEMGQLIARISPTDSVSTGVHLDLKFWRDAWVDPQIYFEEAIAQRAKGADLVSVGPSESLLTDEELKKAIGAAEGTVDWETLEPDDDYDGHPDPCVLNGTCPSRGTNMGYFSYDQGGTPEEANRLQLIRLRKAEQTIQQQAISDLGRPLSKGALAVALDAWNQSPKAGEDVVRHLTTADPTPQQLIDARVASYYDPVTQQLDAPGLGNTRLEVVEDQRRRVGAVLYALAKLGSRGSPQFATPEITSEKPLSSRQANNSPSLIEELLAVAVNAGQDINALSISILNVRTGKLIEHNGDVLRYPASLVKVHWALAAESIHPGVNDAAIHAALQDSDNGAANLLLESVGADRMNQFWENKSFLGVFSGGFDGGGASNNRVTTNDMVKLMAGLVENPSNAEAKVRDAMARDYKAERAKQYNAIDGFLLDDFPETPAYSKPGWVAETRADAVLVKLDRDWYAISMIGDSRKYAESETIFPAFGYTIYHGIN